MTRWGRVAIYYAPRRGSALARWGAAWLGRDAETGAPVETPEPFGLLPRPRSEITAAPRRYGFHATLKAPFRLADSLTPDDLSDAVRDLAAGFGAFALPPLRVEALGRFLALTPAVASPEIDAVARACVERLDNFRLPPSEAELARRRAARLSPAEAANLAHWGYPYVLDTFRFHMTLTDPLEPPEQAATHAALVGAAAPALAGPTRFEDLCVFGEDGDGVFHVLSRHPLAGEAPP